MKKGAFERNPPSDLSHHCLQFPRLVFPCDVASPTRGTHESLHAHGLRSTLPTYPFLRWFWVLLATLRAFHHRKPKINPAGHLLLLSPSTKFPYAVARRPSPPCRSARWQDIHHLLFLVRPLSFFRNSSI